MAQIQPLQPLHSPVQQHQPASLYLPQPPADHHQPPVTLQEGLGGVVGAPPAPQPPPAIPYHIYQNVVLAALNSGTVAGLGQPLTIPTTTQASSEPPHHQPKVSAAPTTVTHSLFNDLQIKTEHAEHSQQNLLGLQVSTNADVKPATILPSNNALLNPLPPQQQHLVQPPQQLEPLPTLDPTALQPLQPMQHHHHQQQFMLPLPLSLQQNALDHHQEVSPPGEAVLPQQPEPTKKKRGKRGPQQSGEKGEKVHACTECPYTCNRADKLRVHVKGVHNNDKPFLCTFCYKGFKQRDKVSRHVNTVHYRERPYACDYCPLAFGRKDKVKRHISTVHLGERPYRCNYCSHNTTRRDKMRIHLQQVHQSLDGSEHYIIDRAPQGQPRVLVQNTNRNVADIIAPIAVPPATPTPAAVLPQPGTTRLTVCPKQEPPEDIKPALLGLPEGIQVTQAAPATTTAPATTPLPPIVSTGQLLNSMVGPVVTAAQCSAARLAAVDQLTTQLSTQQHPLVTQQSISMPVNMVWGSNTAVAQENSSAINNVAMPLRIVGKM